METPTPNRKWIAGFSLVELAVVVVIMGILLTMGIKMATSFQDRSAYSLTHSKQIAVRDALIAYLAAHGRLPCPAIVTPSVVPTGLENPTPSNGTCNNSVGIIPFQTLQLPQEYVLDGWERFFTYEVWDDSSPAACASVPNHANFTSAYRFLGVASNSLTHHDGDGGCIAIQEDTNLDGTIDITRYVTAAIVSHGTNGFGGFTSKGSQVDYGAVGATNHEKDNIAGHSSRTPHTFHTEPFNPDFDDVVLEISPSDLVTPLKRDGTIVSINQLARDQLLGNRASFISSPGAGVCNLMLPVNYTPKKLDGDPTLAGSSYPGLVITFAMTTPSFTSSTTISASDYRDSGGHPCTIITVP